MACFRELLEFINQMEFVRTYGNLHMIPKRLNQDLVESFFSVQRQLCGGSRNMTAYVYAYNINGILSYKSANLVSRSQTNINSMQEVTADLNALAADTLPRRAKSSSINDQVDWDVFI